MTPPPPETPTRSQVSGPPFAVGADRGSRSVYNAGRFDGTEAYPVAFPFWLVKFLVRTRLARWLPATNRLTDGGAAFIHYYNDRVLESPAQELRNALPFLEAIGHDLIDLSLGSPRFDVLPSGTTAKLPADLRGYPPPLGLAELREAIAHKLRNENDVTVSATEEVLVTAGASAALSFVLDTFINPGDRVVLLDPTYLMYPLAVRSRRAEVLWVPTEVNRGRVLIPWARFVQALRRARMFILNTPANPTGAVIAPEELERIAWWADRHDVLLFSDEVYEQFQYEGRFVSIGSLAKARQRTLTANSLSKSHGLAAYRVGWLAAHRHLLRPCAMSAALQCPFVPTICQQLALTALALPAETFQPIRAEFESRRRYVHDRLQGMGLQPVWPAGAFYSWVPVRNLNLTGRAFAERLLKEKGVLLLPGDLFGPSGKHMMRISYATEDGRLREGLNRLGEFVRALAPVAKPAPRKRAA